MNKKVDQYREELQEVIKIIKEKQKRRKHLDSAIRLIEWRKKKRESEK